jgi:hypothetical protein
LPTAAATLFQPSELHYERPRNICSKTWQLQQLYECTDGKDIGTGTSDGLYSWRRENCVPDDKLAIAPCEYFSTQVIQACPGAQGLTAETAGAYQCSDVCAKTIVSMYEYCGTSWFHHVDALTPTQKGAYYTLIAREPDGPCTATLAATVSAMLLAVARDPVCGIRYDVCAGRDYCRREMREGIASTLFGNPDVERQFETTLCEKSTEFQWLYECIDASATLGTDTSTGPQFAGQVPWTLAQCADRDVLRCRTPHARRARRSDEAVTLCLSVSPCRSLVSLSVFLSPY